MPPVAQSYIKAAFVYFVVAFLLGALMMLDRWLNFSRWLKVVYLSQLHLLVVGWITQLAIGVAYWMFPRLRKDQDPRPRGSEALAYAVLIGLNAFFVAIEFIFRGFLLFGLAGVRDSDVKGAGTGAPGVFYFHKYALLIQMLSYTAWHLGKPAAELWGTPIWGLCAGALAYAARSIWPVTAAHWVLNIWIDAIVVGYV